MMGELIMKKTIKLLQLIFGFSCILLFASCRNSSGGNVEDRTIIFNGSFEVQESLLRQIDTSSYTIQSSVLMVQRKVFMPGDKPETLV